VSTFDFGLGGTKVVIIGSSTGIGLEVAKHFAEQDVDLVVTSHLDDVFDAKAEIEQETGRTVTAMKFDIAERDQVREAFEEIGELDVLINNAGIAIQTPPDDLSDETADTFRRHFDVNVLGTYWCAQEAAARMKPGGRIIFTASIWGRVAVKGDFAAYTATKHAVLGLVRSLACDLGEKGITVNAVCPGSMGTELLLRTFTDEQVDFVSRQMVVRPGLIPPAHLAGTYMFLSSEASSEITGQEISVDRGQTIGGNQG
jgi:NAD(P)-dependent dehydrogenase (short-subunit alcohol dehydrogenase family)